MKVTFALHVRHLLVDRMLWFVHSFLLLNMVKRVADLPFIIFFSTTNISLHNSEQFFKVNRLESFQVL